ncbi:cyclic pyranopterin phosphate synthase MoaA [Tenacibaculum sp. SZ-18]|uniref:GTP 3',8-cyclase MoaA n=1 Tax=Tenacibaculum sp. SZ-18 TaxID=754423 RepID=UPI000C2D5E44|nr:GTP 3',8-cyclase MoaA [Tenacibaculum sp. SZ-18]AUC16313.1 cyclic pyranopterin phosphate synthase MoaA [Tenacibaculum sp. SZ-18]
MSESLNILQDTFERNHNYLRISLTEKCNLRCTYCMPINGVPLSPKSHIMTAEEVYEIAKVFVKNGVDKIRLTGGEPLLRKDFPKIIQMLSALNVQMSITSNAVLIDRHINILKRYGVNDVNISLDTLATEKFIHIAKRDQFKKVYENLLLLIDEGFRVKVNVVLIKGFNETEIIDFVKLTKELPISVRFIEFMPFDGNEWEKEKIISYDEIMRNVCDEFEKEYVERLADAKNDTTKNYKIKFFKGSFGIISSVTNPFCDTCNRIRLTANGNLKNCLFSNSETNLLTKLREGKSIEPIIQKVIKRKYKMRGGMDSMQKLENPSLHQQNRSMITIGG